MKVVVLTAVRFSGTSYKAGDFFDLPDQFAPGLIAIKAVAEVVGEVVEESQPNTSESRNPILVEHDDSEAIEELLQVEGMNRRTAEMLVGAGIDGIAALQEATLAQLCEIKGIKEATASKILANAIEGFQIEE